MIAVAMMDPILSSSEQERPLKRVEYDQLVELGAFREERIELLYGRLIAMSPQGARHAEIIKRLNRWLVIALGEQADVNVQLPFAATEDSQPEPDLSVVPKGDYSGGHPSEAFLVIEVAGPSARKDRLVKADLYAIANVEAYWIVDLDLNCVEVRTDPQAGGFRSLVTLRPGGILTLPRFPSVAIPVDKLLL